MIQKLGPIVKWAGGKTQLLPHLLRRIPPEIKGRYIEPFAGGAALFFAVQQRAKSAVLADSNQDLISMYSVVGRHVERLILDLRRHQRRHSAEHYYSQRDRWNSSKSWTKLERASSFIYLNKTCFNGLWRVNRSGLFNVPMGRYTAPLICQADELRAAAPVLRRTELVVGDYQQAAGDARTGDFVYFDPPYDTDKDNFTGYTSGAFGTVEQVRLALFAQELAAAGAKVMVSNADTKLVREIYRRVGFRFQKISCGRSIAARGGDRARAQELIITSPNLGYFSTH